MASISGAPIAGAMYGAAKSYDIPFYVAGFCFILAGLMSLGAQILASGAQTAFGLAQNRFEWEPATPKPLSASHRITLKGS